MKNSFLCSTGPWGRLEAIPFLISPPVEFSAFFEEDKIQRPWHFPGLSPSDTFLTLLQLGWTHADATQLFSQSGVINTHLGTDLLPAASFVRSLPPDLRAILYRWLANASDDSHQKNAFRFFGETLEDWIRGATLKPKTIELIRPYVYRQGSFLMFADLPSVVEKLHDTHEAALLIKALSREMTMRMKLHVHTQDDLEQIVSYWGRGGRRMDVTPMLESLTHFEDAQFIDIVHLLPPIPRRLLYTYPRPGRDRFERERTCYWTALNFFNDEPDDNLLDLHYVQQVIERDWSIVTDAPLLGDIALYHELGTDIIHHAAAYIADNIVFSKNGPGLVRPWMLVQQEYLQDFYYRNAQLGIRYYRRNDLL